MKINERMKFQIFRA